MKRPKSLLLISLIALLPLACQRQDKKVDSALLWFQRSAECRALFFQTYALAGERMRQIMSERGSEGAAIVIDIDETVLDNSPQQAGLWYNPQLDAQKSWENWCKAAIAQALPGAVDFLAEADRLGFTLFYVSNRDVKHHGATLRNLAAVGCPQSQPDQLRLRDQEASKENRRQAIAQNHEIVLLLGDSLNDLSVVFEKDILQERRAQVDAHRSDFGRRFILFPNPVYGSWRKAKDENNEPLPLKIWPLE